MYKEGARGTTRTGSNDSRLKQQKCDETMYLNKTTGNEYNKLF